ncbi:hypothetical protein H8Z72_23520 (plasmid) [Xanthomonas citri pv. citri]|uniref:hypothetical protein n=1 Tax=Xanthomonas citri TaxID=346 RepID=UPI001932D50F|nr:hypothetical protein [Xanthomonas citri]QRD62715.1 hypothetical protein H8Z74_22665 [Xanthomonas citri pv. citri]QRD67042.1 hypothetical protein H8Z73_22750 [Xanthomonas citri pv. citri]QRD71705.1 hypothetical protein H8Z72_23520 [Xanthomonas citri pv. citri]
MKSALQLEFDEVCQHLESVRRAALQFFAALGAAQPRYRLAEFGVAGFFAKAIEEGYSELSHIFVRDRSRAGIVPNLDDSEVRRAFLGALDVRSLEDIEAADVSGQIALALARLTNILPEEAAQATINAQLAARAFTTLNLSGQGFVERAGKVVLANRAWIDSIDKKFSKTNNYHYSCRDQVRQQIAVMSDLVRQYNVDRGKCVSTQIPQYHVIDDAARHLSRSPNVLQVLGAELKFKVTCFEWHLTQDFAAYMSEFISLHLRR